MKLPRSLFTFEKIPKSDLLEIIFGKGSEINGLSKEELLETTSASEKTPAKEVQLNQKDQKGEKEFWTEIPDPLKCEDDENAINSPIAAKILNDFYSRFGTGLTKILSFRKRLRKNSGDRKFERFVLGESYTGDFRGTSSRMRIKKEVKKVKKDEGDSFSRLLGKIGKFWKGNLKTKAKIFRKVFLLDCKKEIGIEEKGTRMIGYQMPAIGK